jgi:hypothetical protein
MLSSGLRKAMKALWHGEKALAVPVWGAIHSVKSVRIPLPQELSSKANRVFQKRKPTAPAPHTSGPDRNGRKESNVEADETGRL